MSLKRSRDGSPEENERDGKRAKASEPAITKDEHQLSYPSPSSTNPPTKSPPFQQPTQLLTFSYSPTRDLLFDDSALRYYVLPPQGAKLSYGYDKWVRRGVEEEKGRVDSLLRALCRIKEGKGQGGEVGKERVEGLGVVCWRGVLTKILTAPYSEERDDWELNVMNVGGTLYFEEFVSDERVKEKQAMQTYYGYAFESYCTSDTPRRNSDAADSTVPFGWSGDVNNNVQWCSVIRTKLGNTRILIGGEVDCVRDKYTGQPDTFVELKTSLTIRGPHDEARFEKSVSICCYPTAQR
ncbi:hypothetical protein NP233_g11584 [Leucocoprinus birnbaumii]|uniref:Decapping nuclease n=1 Tax=Leucocoprinus birnbaumii TaxID=56174 RepID=A0AAD5VGB4_9AGAR|nr:hypothetical protein NP233_g11584 [Leucocoprinus birnbaumii]